MAQSMTARIVGLAGNDPLFARIRQEAEEAMRREPELATFLMTTGDFKNARGEIEAAENLDSEIGDLVGVPLQGRSWFSYVRYNKSYGAAMLRQLLEKHPTLSHLDAIHAIPALQEIGSTYARECVKLEHLI